MLELLQSLLQLFLPKDPEDEIDSGLVEDREETLLPIEFKNGSARLSSEYKQLSTENPYLYNLINDLNQYINDTFSKNLVITMIYRTQAEQDYLYRNSAKYKERKFKSPHQFWHGVDIRSRTFTSEEIAKIEQYINDKHNAANYYKWTAKNHTVGSGYHFHIQFSR